MREVAQRSATRDLKAMIEEKSSLSILNDAVLHVLCVRQAGGVLDSIVVVKKQLEEHGPIDTMVDLEVLRTALAVDGLVSIDERLRAARRLSADAAREVIVDERHETVVCVLGEHRAEERRQTEAGGQRIILVGHEAGKGGETRGGEAFDQCTKAGERVWVVGRTAEEELGGGGGGVGEEARQQEAGFGGELHGDEGVLDMAPIR